MPVVVLVLAWLVPGAGHICLNRVTRGIIIFVTIGATFWAGVAMGGVMTVDAFNERWWFVAEMFTGAHGLIGWQRQKQVYDRYDRELDHDRPYGDMVSRYAGHLPPGATDDAVRQIKQKFTDKLLQRDGLALVSPIDTVARAYAGVAGLLNLMCVFDAVILSMMGRSGEPPPVGRPKPERQP